MLPSNRNFGLLFVVVFAAAGGYGYFRHGFSPWVAGCAAAAGLLLLVVWRIPAALAPLNKGWHRLSLLLGKIVSPVVLGILYYGLITPVAVLSRLFGRDELRLRPRAAASYWMERVPPGPEPGSFKNQF